MIDALLATLKRDAEAEIARLGDEGRSGAAAIAAACTRRLAELRQAALGAKEAAGREGLARRLAGARQAARARVLAARAEVVDRLLVALRAALPEAANTPAYRARLADELPRVLAFTPNAEVVVRCAPALQGTLRGLVRSNGRLRIEPDAAIAAGYRIEVTDGTLDVDATLEGRLEGERARLAQAALTLLESR